MVTALVDGRRAGELKLDRPGHRPASRCSTTLQQFRFGNDLKPGGAGTAADNPEFKVIIRGDEDMGYQFLEPVLITCAEAKVKNVNFNTKTAGGHGRRIDHCHRRVATEVALR